MNLLRTFRHKQLFAGSLVNSGTSFLVYCLTRPIVFSVTLRYLLTSFFKFNFAGRKGIFVKRLSLMYEQDSSSIVEHTLPKMVLHSRSLIDWQSSQKFVLHFSYHTSSKTVLQAGGSAKPTRFGGLLVFLSQKSKNGHFSCVQWGEVLNFKSFFTIFSIF